MKVDIQKLISIQRQKNGRIKIKHDISNEANIYKLLNEMGFFQSKLNGKRIYFQRKNGKVEIVNIRLIRDAFFNLLENENYLNRPEDISKEDILNWFLGDNPIKQNGLFEYHLKSELSEFEKHQILIKEDKAYKIDYTLSRFEKWNFEKTIDSSGIFTKGKDLYFKKVNGEDFLIFTHHNKSHLINSGFDSWIAKFDKESEIGNKKPSKMEVLKFSFDIEKDFGLIKEYV